MFSGYPDPLSAGGYAIALSSVVQPVCFIYVIQNLSTRRLLLRGFYRRGVELDVLVGVHDAVL